MKRFVLLCHQRSGSNALDSLINAHPALGLYGQLFNNSVEYRRHLQADLDLPLFRAHPDSLLHYGAHPPWPIRLEHWRLALAPRERSLECYMNDFWQRFAGKQNWQAAGFKLHDFQLVDADLIDLLARHVDGVVLLHRRNLLKAAVSWACAVRSAVWVRREGGSTGQAEPMGALDINELRWFIDKTATHVAHWRKVVADSGVPCIEFDYETLIEARELGALWRFLQVQAPPAVRFGTRRIATADYAHVGNAAQIDAQLGNTRTGFLFEPAVADAG